MRRHCRAGDVDRVRLPGAGVVADVDLLLSLAFPGRGGQLCRRRAAGRAGRLTHGAGRLTGRRCGRLALVVCLLEVPVVVFVALGVVVSEVAGRRRRRSRAGRRRDGRRRLRGDLGEADSCGCRERQPDDGSDERAAPESAESVPHDAFPSLGVLALPPSVAVRRRNLRRASARSEYGITAVPERFHADLAEAGRLH